jgi:uncharacterized damage-inducible protein DinB
MNAPERISAVEDVLQQGRAMLVMVSGDTYTRRQGGPSGASLGAHYRHVLDHFLCLIAGIQNGEVNYDRRGRSAELENSADAALLTTDNLIEEFRALPSETWQRQCTVVYSIGYGDSEPQAVPSNLARELMFTVGHAIHHFAILRLLCASMSITLPYEFGMAPSTLKYQEAQAAH